MPPDVPRRAVLAAMPIGLLAGCVGAIDRGGPTATATAQGGTAIGAEAPQLGPLELTSPAFDHGGPIPRRYGQREQDVNPPLRIAGVPDGAESLVLVVDDPDAPGTVWLHWLVWNVDPGTTAIPEGWDAGGAVEGVNDSGRRGYSGPAPPDREHRYRFKLYALDAALDLPPDATTTTVGAAMDGHVLARTQLDGTYAPAGVGRAADGGGPLI